MWFPNTHIYFRVYLIWKCLIQFLFQIVSYFDALDSILPNTLQLLRGPTSTKTVLWKGKVIFYFLLIIEFCLFSFSFDIFKALGEILSAVKGIPILVFSLCFIDLVHVIECKELQSKRILDTSILWLGLSGQLCVSCPIVGTSR